MSDAAGHGTVETAAYLRWSRTPAAGLLFLLPWLTLYELAILTGSDPTELRHPAESWLRSGLLHLGGAMPWLLPVVVATSLLLWHGWDRWRRGPAVRTDRRGTLLAGMLGESALAASLLVLGGQLLHAAATRGVVMSLAESPNGPEAWAATCLGAGIYEEVLFRLWAIPLVLAVLRSLLVPRTIAIALSLAGTAVLFAALHYTAADWQTLKAAGAWSPMALGLLFRIAAGGVFAMLFWVRGFGIAVGTHVLYDAIVVLVAAMQDAG